MNERAGDDPCSTTADPSERDTTSEPTGFPPAARGSAPAASGGGSPRTTSAAPAAADGSESMSPFQKVIAELTGGCQCACHTGIGSSTSCEHCMQVTPKGWGFSGHWVCSNCGFKVPFGNAHYCPTTVKVDL